MARATSLDKYLAALAGTGYIVRQVNAPPANQWVSGEIVVYAMSQPALEANVLRAQTQGGYHNDGNMIGNVTYFDLDGSFLYGARMILRVAHNYQQDPTNYIWWAAEAGTRWKKLHKTLKAAIAEMETYAPVAVEKRQAAQVEAEAKRLADAMASAGRVKALKPDVRQSVWTIQHEMERAQSSYASNLKAVVSRAEDLLRRAEEAPGFVYESELTNLARIVADAVSSGGKVQALGQVVRSEFAPLFEGSPWSDA